MADRVERLREAAQARHEATLRRAESVLQRMAKRGDPVTFNRVAETAGVSRSWLYRQPMLRREIDRLRDASAARPGVLPLSGPPPTRSGSKSTPTETRSPGCAVRTRNCASNSPGTSAPPARPPSHDPQSRRRRHVHNKKDGAPQQIPSEGSREPRLTRFRFNADAGGQYTSVRFTERLLEAGIDASIGTVGDAHDNSLAESINGLYKTELIKPRRPWRNANHVEAETAPYLDWFNNRRLYEYCGDMPPVKRERIFYGTLSISEVA